MVDTAQTLTAQIALGLQNARLLSEAQRRAEQLQRITAFSQSSQATLDLPVIFKNMLAESVLMLPQDRVSISLYDSEREALRVVAEHAGGVNTVNLDGGDIIRIFGHIAQAWDSRELVHIPDTHKLRDQVNLDSSVRAWMFAPIVTREGLLGLVSVGSARPYIYGETDIALFRQLVTQLAVALENATAYNQSQRMVRNESLLNNISTQLQNQITLEQMMDVTVTELGRALGARRARIRLGQAEPSNGS
jgi:GAF domain-containing protein